MLVLDYVSFTFSSFFAIKETSPETLKTSCHPWKKKHVVMSYLIALNVGLMELAVQGQTGSLTVREVESLGCHNTLSPGGSVKVHFAILKVTELLTQKWRLAILYVPVTLAWASQDQLLHIREEGFVDIRQVKQRGLAVGRSQQQHHISPACVAETLIHPGISNIRGWHLFFP